MGPTYVLNWYGGLRANWGILGPIRLMGADWGLQYCYTLAFKDGQEEVDKERKWHLSENFKF